MKRNLLLPAAALAVATLVAGCGSASDATRTEGGSSSVVSGDSSGTDGSGADQSPAAQIQVAEQGFTQLPAGSFSEPSVSYAVVFENTGTAIATNARVQLTFKGADGAVISAQSEYLNAVLPGSKVAVGNTLYDVDGVTELVVQVLPGGSEEVEDEAADFTSEQVSTVQQEYGGLKTTGTIGSPFAKDLQDLYVAAVYRGTEGQIIGGDFTFLSFVPAKGSAGVEVTSMGDGLTPTYTELYTQLSSLTLLD